jgi:hypothetical protein
MRPGAGWKLTLSAVLSVRRLICLRTALSSGIHKVCPLVGDDVDAPIVGLAHDRRASNVSSHMECTLKLNPKVRWSDGKPWTSADVVFSQQLLLKNFQINGAAGVTEDVAAVSAPDAQNVFADPCSAGLLFRLRFPQRALQKA